MRYLLGFIAEVIVLFIASYLLLGVWDIEIISKHNLNRLLMSIAIIFVTAAVLVLLIIIPFKKSFIKNYDNSTEGIAEKKIE